MATSAPPTGSNAPVATADGGVHPSAKNAHDKLSWIDDDVPAAISEAKASGKVVFIDACAQWSHTCASMKHFVLGDPSLRSLTDSVVFAAVDTEREKNAPFVDRYAIDAWPTFFVIEPQSGALLGYWPGAASASEMDSFIRSAIAARDARNASTLDPKSPMSLLLEAKEAQASSRYRQAARLYGEAVLKAPADWNRRSEALIGWIGALYNGGSADECVTVGLRFKSQVQGAAAPTDFFRSLLACAEDANDPKRRIFATEIVKSWLIEIVESPHPESTPDGRADTLEVLADVLDELGDKQGALEAYRKRLKLLEEAAAEASSPSAAATYDSARVNTYLQLGRPNDAIKMLEERENQFPESYLPPARLASVLSALNRYPEALSAIDRALKNAYGPRRLRYLETKANIQGLLDDYVGQIKTLEEEVAGREAHAKRQTAKPKRLEIAKQRFAEAKKALSAARKNAASRAVREHARQK